ncbi:AraC family transcriptional regulator [Kineothrix sp. MB12-C1]|uniref:AraC family transcriptional regulator n=1 Tax=Kineothrix sp. MB12-C1 TaxID=3070215 RepID=UPI0027D26324|nr:AraC family transcriptional regulator [Kineothrix sp. MB12-C1]WMC94457.1 AraC family transcriptional regulator [Kineothrix sp. MB12-C1]
MKYKHGLFGILNADEMSNPPLYLSDGGIESRYQEVYDLDNRKRKGYGGFVFQYTLSGYGYLEMNQKVNRVNPGMGFVVSVPGDSRYYINPQEEVAWEFIYLHFYGDSTRPFIEKLSTLCDCLFHIDKSSSPIQQLFKLQNRMITGGYLHKYEGQEILYHFLCSLLREIEFPSKKTEDSLVSHAIRLIDAEYNTLEGIYEVAKRLNISQEHLARNFKIEQGVTPIKYLTNIRIQAAINMLLSTTNTIKVIAENCGFSNSNYFSKVFKKYVHLSPEKYREQYKF